MSRRSIAQRKQREQVMRAYNLGPWAILPGSTSAAHEILANLAVNLEEVSWPDDYIVRYAAAVVEMYPDSRPSLKLIERAQVINAMRFPPR